MNESGGGATAIIPARGGSKGLPGKNLAQLGDKPLIAHSITAAIAASGVDRVIVSTDAPEIADVARSWGAEVPGLRPDHLARDESGTPDVIRYLIETCDLGGTFVLLQPTSPLRGSEDIDACLERLAVGDVLSCVSVSALDKAPEWIFTLDGEDAATDRLVPLKAGPAPLRRQDASRAYVLNGAVYAMRVADFMEHSSLLTAQTAGYAMPTERSVDIDTADDLAYAQTIMKSVSTTQSERERGNVTI